MNNSPQPAHNDEIDLFDLIITLWKGRYIILATTTLFVAAAALLAFIIIQPSYKAQTKISPPFLYQIDIINDGVVNNLTTNNDKASYTPTLKAVDANSVYSTMIDSLNSTNLQRQFFEKNYIPKQAKPIKLTQAKFEEFQKRITITQTNKEQNHYSIAITTHDPNESYQLINEFMMLANDTAKGIVLKNRKTEINTLVSNIKNILNSMEVELIAQKNSEINTLKNAHTIAEKLGIKTPQKTITDPYMQGTEVLSNHIEFLEKNRKNFSDNTQYNGLMANLNMYQKISLPSLESFDTYYTNALSYVPEIPIKPQKKLIILVGLLLGVFLGILIVIIRQAIRNYIKNKK